MRDIKEEGKGNKADDQESSEVEVICCSPMSPTIGYKSTNHYKTYFQRLKTDYITSMCCLKFN